MPVTVSYKKQFALGIMFLILILVVIEAFAWMYEFNENPRICSILGSDVFGDTDFFMKQEMCRNHLFLTYEKMGHLIRTSPNQQIFGIEVNSHGYKGPEFTAEKPPNVYRIFILGGSTVFGVGPNEDSIAGFMQKKFNNSSLTFPVEVINAGINGQYSWGEWYLIKNELIHFDPDLFIIYDGINDSINRNREPNTKLLNATTPNESLYKNFPFYRTPVVINKIISPPTTQQQVESYRMSEETHTRVVTNWKERWIDVCEFGKEKGFATLVTVQPMVGTGKPLAESEISFAPITEDQQRSVTILGDLANSLDDLQQVCTKTADLRGIFDNVEEPLFFDAHHVHKAGNEIISQELFELTLPIIEQNTG